VSMLDFGPLNWNNSHLGLSASTNQYISDLLAAYPSEGPFYPPDRTGGAPSYVAPGLLPAWQYRTAAELGDSDRFRITSYMYSPDGFVYHVPGNTTKESYEQMINLLVLNGWNDRATREVLLDMNFVNPNNLVVANLELKLTQTAGGLVSSTALCGTVGIVDPFDVKNLQGNVPDVLLLFWLILMTYDALDRCLEKRGIGWVWIRSGETFLHFAIVLCCGWALILRTEFVQLQKSTYDASTSVEHGDAFQSQFAHLVFLSETSSLALAIAFWLCMMRLSFYYSLFSTRFFLLRKAIVRCFTALIPAFCLIFITLLGFAFFAHCTFGATAPQWSTIQRTVANLIVMTRKPSLMNLREMEASDPLVTLGVDTAVVGPLFFIGYTFSVVILFTAVARSVVIHANTRATQDDDGSPPDDMVADSPWPSLNPVVYYRYYTRRHASRFREAQVAIAGRLAMHGQISKQKRLQRAELQKQDEERRTRRDDVKRAEANAAAGKAEGGKAAAGKAEGGKRTPGRRRSKSPKGKKATSATRDRDVAAVSVTAS